MQTFEEFLTGYAPALPEFFAHPVLSELIAANRASVPISHDRYRLSGRVQFMVKDMEHGPNRRAKEKGYAYYLHIPDKKLVQHAAATFTGPLAGIPVTNFYWHSLYLNLFAYLSGQQVSRLLLVQMYNGCTAHSVNYRPDLMRVLLENHVPVQKTFTPAAEVMARMRQTIQTKMI